MWIQGRVLLLPHPSFNAFARKGKKHNNEDEKPDEYQEIVPEMRSCRYTAGPNVSELWCKIPLGGICYHYVIWFQETSNILKSGSVSRGAASQGGISVIVSTRSIQQGCVV